MRYLAILLSLFLLSGCATFDTKGTKAQTGLSDFVSGDTVTPAKLNAIKNTADTADALATVNQAAIVVLQAYDTALTALTDGGVLIGQGTAAPAAMAVLADSEMIVGDGTTDPVPESGATLRTSIGVGTGDSPQFTGVELGHATDTTITRSGAGALEVEGSAVILASDLENPPTEDEDEKAPTSEWAYDLEQTVSGLAPSDSDTFRFEAVVPELLENSETPEVEDNGVYYCYGLGDLLITDFVDGDDDHTDFSIGDSFKLIMDDSNVRVDCADNATIECNANTVFRGHDTQIREIVFVFAERQSDSSTYWSATNLDSGFSDALTLSISDGNIGSGTWQAGKKIFNLAASTDLDLSTYGDSEVYVTGDPATIGLWDCSTTNIGTGLRIGVIGAVEVYVDSAGDPTNDLFELISGALTDAGDNLALVDEAGNEFYQLRCRADNKWSVIEEINIASGSENAADGGAAAACSSCPAIAGSVTFCYDGEHATDSDTATGASGDLAGTVSGATIHGDYAYCGSYGVLLDDNEYIQWTLTDNTDIDAATGTLHLRVLSPASWTGTTSLSRTYVDSTHRIYSQIYSTGRIYVRHESGSDVATIYTTGAIPTGQWNEIKISWDATTDAVSVKINEDSWEESTSGTVTDFVTTISGNLRVGNANTMADDYSFDNLQITSGYQD